MFEMQFEVLFDDFGQWNSLGILKFVQAIRAQTRGAKSSQQGLVGSNSPEQPLIVLTGLPWLPQLWLQWLIGILISPEQSLTGLIGLPWLLFPRLCWLRRSPEPNHQRSHAGLCRDVVVSKKFGGPILGLNKDHGVFGFILAPPVHANPSSCHLLGNSALIF